MIKEERQKGIIDFLEPNEYCDTEFISVELAIPLTTLRRDLNDLSDQGLIERYHGGVKRKQKSWAFEDLIETKLKSEVGEKQRIARKAILVLEKNDHIFIDSGSTTFYLTNVLPTNLNLTIVTNSILHAQNLINHNHQKVYLLGGLVNINLGAITGYEAIKALENYRFNRSFLGVNGIDENGLLYTTNSDQAQLKTKVIDQSEKSYVLSTSIKLNKKAFYQFSSTNVCQIINEKENN